MCYTVRLRNLGIDWNGKVIVSLKVKVEEHSKRRRQELQTLSQSSAGSN
jgi:hypothetical protein